MDVDVGATTRGFATTRILSTIGWVLGHDGGVGIENTRLKLSVDLSKAQVGFRHCLEPLALNFERSRFYVLNWECSLQQETIKIHCALARTYYAARNSEDTSERTFSGLGRQLSDLRKRADPAHATAAATCVA